MKKASEPKLGKLYIKKIFNLRIIRGENLNMLLMEKLNIQDA